MKIDIKTTFAEFSGVVWPTVEVPSLKLNWVLSKIRDFKNINVTEVYNVRIKNL